jgi:hypothetical protein
MDGLADAWNFTSAPLKSGTKTSGVAVRAGISGFECLYPLKAGL